MRGKITLLFWILIGAVSGVRAQYISVDDTYTAQQLVENVLVNSPCANVNNISVTGDTFSGAQQSYGYFSAAPGIFPFTGGVILATSRANQAPGPNTSLIDEGSNAWPGDADLELALNIHNTYNATVLEFDFTPLSSQVSFDYLFASEEYHGSATCTYSDGFAFLLKPAGSTAPYQNLALVPNTSTPVLVTTVHPEIPGSCPAQNEQYFGSFNGASAPINYNGQTVLMTAKANVVPFTTYHIKLVIADHENIRYDSAIFLGAGSFKVGTDIGPDRLVATGNPVCTGKTITLDATETTASGYQWYKDNVLQAGETNATYTVSAPGTYSVDVALGTLGCTATGSVEVEYAALPNLGSAILVQCDEDGDGSAAFNLTRADQQVINGETGLNAVVYYRSWLDAENELSPIGASQSLNFESVPTSVYARVSNAFGCYSIATVQLQIVNHNVANFPLLEVCDHDPDPVQDGFYFFTLSDGDSQVLDGLPPGLSVEYYETIQDALLEPGNVLPNIYHNTERNYQTIYAKILNGPDCYDIIPVNLVVNSLAPPDFEDAHLTLCDKDTAVLSVNPIYVTYLWSTGETTPQITISEPGTYTITVGENDCEATKTFIVSAPVAPIITSVDVQDMTATDNTILVHYTGTGDYVFSLDGVNFQPSPYFTGVAAGEYLLIMRDTGACTQDTELVSVVNYPRYFTPNADGNNDYWTLPILKNIPGSTVSIFDRMGKLILRFDCNSAGWDGKMNARELPATDYWFVADLKDRTVRGHFALKR